MRFLVGLLTFFLLISPAFAEKKPKPTNNMPKTMQEYYRAVNKAADEATNIPAPKLDKDTKIVDIPAQPIKLKKYNNPPGLIDINLNDLKKKRHLNSIGVVSPTFDKMAYSQIFYYPATRTASSELYIMNLDMGKELKDRIENAHINKGRKTIYRTGMDTLDLDIQRTLTIIDWSSDGKRLAIKEKISYTPDGLWKTNLLVCDLETGKTKNLSEVREAIQYYWKEKEDLNLKENRWDIYPIGWDSMNPDRLIVFAYAATGEKPKYLGAWSIDYFGDRTMLMSLTKANFEVSQNGTALQTIGD